MFWSWTIKVVSDRSIVVCRSNFTHPTNSTNLLVFAPETPRYGIKNFLVSITCTSKLFPLQFSISKSLFEAILLNFETFLLLWELLIKTWKIFVEIFNTLPDIAGRPYNVPANTSKLTSIESFWSYSVTGLIVVKYRFVLASNEIHIYQFYRRIRFINGITNKFYKSFSRLLISRYLPSEKKYYLQFFRTVNAIIFA